MEVGVALEKFLVIFDTFGIKVIHHRKYYVFDTFEGYLEDTIADNPWLYVNHGKAININFKIREKNSQTDQTCTFFKGDCRKTIQSF